MEELDGVPVPYEFKLIPPAIVEMIFNASPDMQIKAIEELASDVGQLLALLGKQPSTTWKAFQIFMLLASEVAGKKVAANAQAEATVAQVLRATEEVLNRAKAGS